MEASHHVYMPLPPRLVSQVTGYLPPGSSGGGTDYGLTEPGAPVYPMLSHCKPVTPCPVIKPSHCSTLTGTLLYG